MIVPDLAPSVRGAAWMLSAAFCYVVAAALTRYLDGAYSVFELTFLRAAVALVFLMPVMLRGGTARFRTEQFPLHFVRGAVTYVALLFWFYAVTAIPMGDFYALQFTNPLFTIAFAVIFLREKAGMQNWVATLVGFAGVLVILRPGMIEVSFGALAAIGTAAAYGVVNTVIKILSRKDSAVVITVYANLIVLPLSLVPAIVVWKTPGLFDAVVILAIGLFFTAAQFSVAKSIAVADARVVQPVNFMRLPIAAVIGYVMFSELPDIWTWIGAAVIFSATYYVVWHENTPARCV